MTPEEELAEIQETSARFYRAVESRDLDAIEAFWLHTDYVRCGGAPAGAWCSTTPPTS